MNYENIPQTLKEQALWKREQNGKIPYNPHSGNRAKSNDTGTFADFQTAYTVYSNGGYDGLGIGIFNNIGAIDIDHCINDGVYSDIALDIIQRMGSYTEVSPSGAGIRIIFTVNDFQYDKNLYYINNHKIGLEVYIAGTTSKFVTITGNKTNNNAIVDGTTKLKEVLNTYMLKPLKETSVPTDITEEQQTKDFLKIGLEKDEKLKEYWHGAHPHGNESEDDAGFMRKLLYWCNNDSAKAIQAFRSSPYASGKDDEHKKKLDRADYLPNLAKAMKADRTAAQDRKQWEKQHSRKTEPKTNKKLTIISAPELQKEVFPSTKYLVEDLLPMGSSILAAAPKSGKSWFVLLMGLRIAAGEPFLDYKTNQAGVLYLSFEDTLKRLQERMNKLLNKISPPHLFYFSTEKITLDEGLLESLDTQIREHPEIKLIIIDTFQKIRGQSAHGERWYEHDYREAGEIKEFMDERGLSVLFVHHTSKTKDKDDPFNEITGTNGISGAMDTMLVLKKNTRQSQEATLYVTGRDVSQNELVIRHNELTCRWELLGKASELARLEKAQQYQSSPLVKTIRKLLNESPIRCWTGTATEILNAGEQFFHVPLASSAQQISKDLNAIKDLLYEHDNIVYETHSNGNAGHRHHFYYNCENNEAIAS